MHVQCSTSKNLHRLEVMAHLACIPWSPDIVGSVTPAGMYSFDNLPETLLPSREPWHLTSGKLTITEVERDCHCQGCQNGPRLCPTTSSYFWNRTDLCTMDL